MPDEKKKKVTVVVRGRSCRRIDGSRAALDVGVPLVINTPLISHCT